MKKLFLLSLTLLIIFTVWAADVSLTITVSRDRIADWQEAVSARDPKPAGYTWKEWGERLTKKYWNEYIRDYENMKAMSEAADNSVDIF